MASKPAAKKRRHAEDIPDDNDATLARSDAYWFADGNVVLQAGRRQFKVHQSMLSRNSTIFHGMFSIPQPQDDTTEDGCPLVVLYDSETDVEHLLILLYNPLSVIDRSHKPSYAILTSMLRLGKKYDIKLCWEQGVQAVKEDLPRFENDLFVLNDCLAHSIEILFLAGEHSLRNLLRAVYWTLMFSYDITESVKFFSCIPPNMRPGQWLDDPVTFLEAREHVRRWVMGNTYSCFDEILDRPVDCRQPGLCSIRKSRALIRGAQFDPKILLFWAMTPLLSDKHLMSDLCQRCLSVWKSSHEKALKELWADFFKIAGLDRKLVGWSEGEWSDQD